MSRLNVLESLPVELIADILSELDIASLIVVAYLSRRLHAIASDPSLNPWRRPIIRNLRGLAGIYEPCLKTLSVRTIVPRHNWIEVLSIARPEFLLLEAALPHLRDSEWEECFRRRFLPGLIRWKKEASWKEAFMKILYRFWHRSHSSCSTDESWTKYIVLNRNGSANELEGSSRNYNPMAIFNEMKLQNNLMHLETRIRLVVEFTDVRIIAIGVLHKPRNSFMVNPNARLLLHPPGVEKTSDDGLSRVADTNSSDTSSDSGSDIRPSAEQPRNYFARPIDMYRKLMHPLPSPVHANYPLYTPSSEDKRWIGSGEFEEEGQQWVGGLMLTAQIIGPHTKEPFDDDGSYLQDLDLVNGPGRNQYASFTFADLAAIAPWLEITSKIEGPGLGH